MFAQGELEELEDKKDSFGNGAVTINEVTIDYFHISIK